MDNELTKVLLVYPDFVSAASEKRNTGGNWSEGLASISAVLKQGGHKVSLMHIVYEYDEETFKKKLKEFDYDLIGISCRTTAFEYVSDLVKWAKEADPDCFIWIGSYHATIEPEEVIKVPGVDCVCIGEGEYPALELAQRYKTGDYFDIQSLWFKKPDGEIIRNPVRPLLENLDELPLPDFDLFDYKNLECMRLDTALVMMSRGCLFSCTYCGNSQFRNVYPNKKKYARFRSPENAMLYLETLLKKFPNIKFFNFRDAIFNMYDDWFYPFMEMYTEKIHLPFTCNLRLDIMTEKTVETLKKAGCYLIDVGVESGNEEIRMKYCKRMMTNEQMINAFSWFHKYDFTTMTYNIVGLPHETLAKTLETIKLNVQLNPDKVIPNIFYPYPHTVLADIARKCGTFPDVIPADMKVPFYQEDYPPHEVLYASNFFHKYIKRYKRCAKYRPRWLGKMFEKMYDRRFTSKLVPRKFLNWQYDLRHRAILRTKRFVIRKMPKLYLFLRRKRNRIKENGEAKAAS